MEYKDDNFNRYKATEEIEYCIMHSLLRNHYSPEEAIKITSKMMEHFYDLENLKEYKNKFVIERRMLQDGKY